MQQTYHFHTYPNGIRLIHRHVDSYMGHFGVTVNAGSRDEHPDENGIAHFIEHCIFKGTEKRKAFHILNRIDGVGGELNAFTTKEETCVYASFLKQYYQRTISLLNDIVFHSTFPQKELEKEKDVIIDEIYSYEDTPSELIFDEFEQMVFGRNGLGRLILGTPEKVKQFSSKDILKFINRTYCTDEIVLSSVGNVDFAKLVQWCSCFGEEPSRQNTHHRTAPRNYAPKMKEVNKNTYQTHCVLGNVAYGYKSRKKTAFAILNNLLGGPALNSRLNIGIREKYGFTYSLESNYTAYSDTGLFTIYAGTDEKAMDKTLNLIYKEMQKLRTKKLSVTKLHQFQQQLIGQLLMNIEQNQQEMLSMGKALLNFDKVDTMTDIQKDIFSVTPEQIIEVANEIFDQTKMSQLIYK